MARRVLSSDAESFCVWTVISIDVMRNVLGLILKSMKHVTESFIYVFSAYYVFKFYYSSSRFTMLSIYVITSYLISTLFACSIKFLRSSHLLHDFLLYIHQLVCVIDVFTETWFGRLRAWICVIIAARVFITNPIPGHL